MIAHKANMYEPEDALAKTKKQEKRGRPMYPRSRPEDNPEGLLEVELKEKQKVERGYSRKCKKRHLKDLPAATRVEIAHLYMEDHVLMKDIAENFKISLQLVFKIVKMAKEESEIVQKHVKKEERDARALEVIENVAADMLLKRYPILKAEQVMKKVNKQEDLQVTLPEVRKVLR